MVGNIASRAYNFAMTFRVKLGREADGRWIAEVPELPGTMAYGATRPEALAKVRTLALRVLADRVENGESSRLPRSR